MRIGICDDQPHVCTLLADKIKKLYPEETVSVWHHAKELLAEKELPDILFLDIQMPEINGMQTAKLLRRKKRQMVLVFVTAMEQYVFQAFDVEAFHYLVKPFTHEKFTEVLNSAVAKVWEQNGTEDQQDLKERPSLIITTGGKHLTVRLEEIVYAEVYNRKLILHTMDADIEYYGKMKELEQQAGDNFFRSHRAYLVNFDYIRKYDATSIELEKGRALLSRQYYRQFVISYLKYNQRKGG